MFDETKERFNAAKQQLEKLIHRKRQIRIFFLDDHNNIKPQAQFFVKWFANFCHADRALLKQNPVTGNIDPLAVTAAAARLEVWQEFVKQLHTNEDSLVRQLQQLKEDDRI